MTDINLVEYAYPELSPFFGCDCVGECRNAIVLIGESHYLPKETLCDTTPEIWYSAKSKLDDTDRFWINLAGILHEEIPKGMKNRAHSIWKLSALSINAAGPGFVGATSEILAKIYRRIIAFNFFMRPAREGDSLKWQLSPMDRMVAMDRVKKLFATIHPMGVIILSSCVADNFNFQVLESQKIPFVCTPHPGCMWWNRRSLRSGNKTGPEAIADFIHSISFR